MSSCVLLSLGGVASAQTRSASAPAAPPVPDRFDPIDLLSQTFAAMLGLEQHSLVARRPAAFAAHPVTLRRTDALTLPAMGGEPRTVTLLLAESELRFRLARDLQLRCEVSSHDEPNAAPELQLDFGLEFRF